MRSARLSSRFAGVLAGMVLLAGPGLGQAAGAPSSAGSAAGATVAAPGQLDTAFGAAGTAPIDTGDIVTGGPMAVSARPGGGTYVSGSGFVAAVDPAYTSVDLSFGSGVSRPSSLLDMTTGGDDSPVLATSGSLIRLLPSGVPDAGFGPNGFVRLEGRTLWGTMSVLPDGGVQVLTDAVDPQQPSAGLHVRRFTGAGLPDPTFGTAGAVAIPAAPTDYLPHVAVGPHGRTYVAVTDSAGARVVALGANGAVWGEFGTSGVAAVPLAVVRGMDVDGAGRVVLVGKQASGTPCITRLDAVGGVDRGFATDGSWCSSDPRAGVGWVRVDESGVVTVDLSPRGGIRGPVRVGRLTSAGQPDPAFGSDGILDHPLCREGSQMLGRATEDPSGRVVFPVGCSTDDGGWDRPGLVRLDRTGTWDTSFGRDGFLVVGLTRDRHDTGVLVRHMDDGRVVAVGRSEQEAGLTVSRLTPAGALDPTFSDDGIQSTKALGDISDAHVDSRGAVYVVERAADTGRIVKVTGAGAFDDGFGDRGVLSGSWGSSALDRMDRVVVARSTPTTGLTRLLADGMVDRTFANDGTFATAADEITAVTVDRGGRILLVERTDDFGTTMTIVRLRPDGTLDPTFGGGDGRTRIDGEVSKEIFGTQPDGSVVYGSYYLNSVRRLQPDGTPDPLYGTGGHSVLNPRSAASLHTTIDPLGRVLTSDDQTIVRLDRAGRPDETFGPGGSRPHTDQAALDASTDAFYTVGTRITDEPRVTIDQIVRKYGNGSVAPAASRFVPLAPARVLDTRRAIGIASTAALPAGATLSVRMAGRGGVPTSGVSAVVLTVRATQSTKAGWVTVYPAGTITPTVSSLNLSHAGQTIANQVVVPVGSGGSARSTRAAARISSPTSRGTTCGRQPAGPGERLQ